MKPEEYGDRYLDHLLEQYKLYVEMSDRVSQRRDQANRLYIALLTGLAAVLAIVVDADVFSNVEAVVFLIAGLVGASVCLVWYLTIQAYRALNSGKFAVIHEIEQQLPIEGYKKEWEIIRPVEGKPKYFQLTRIEQFVPGIISIPFLIVIGYSTYLLID